MSLRRALAKKILAWLYPEAMGCRVCGAPAIERVTWGGYVMNLCIRHREEWHFTASASPVFEPYFKAQMKVIAMKTGQMPHDDLAISEYLATERAAGDVVRRWLEDEALLGEGVE